jgi:WD40 repeat protein
MMIRKFYLLLFLLGLKGAFAQTGNIVIPSGHALSIEAILPDKQGKYLYTAEDAKVIMWDMKTHDQLYTFLETKVEEISISHDGTKILLGKSCYSTVSGKLLFKVNGVSGKFTADDADIYTLDGGILVTNVSTQTQTRLTKQAFADYYKAHLEVLDKEHVLLRNQEGWEIWNIVEKKLDFEHKLSEDISNCIYLPSNRVIASNFRSKDLEFRDIYTGKLLKSLPVLSPDFILIPSNDNKDFILSKGLTREDQVFTLFNGSDFTPIRKINSNVSDEIYLSGGHYSGITGILYALAYSDIIKMDTRKNRNLGVFKRQVAALGMDVFNSLEYSQRAGVLNLMTDDSVYKSIDLKKMIPFRHKPLPIHTEMVCFSASGDTIAVFDGDKGHIKNIVSGKFLQSSVKLVDDASSTERENFFFSKNGQYVYFTTHNIPKQLHNLHRVNVKTNLVQQVLSFKGTNAPYLHPDKDLLAAIEVGALYNHAKVWSLITGKLLFDKDLNYNKGDFISLSNDKTKVLLVNNGSTEIYDLPSGNLLTKTKNHGGVGDFGVAACASDFSMVFKGAHNGYIDAANAEGDRLYNIRAHTSSISRILVSPDNKTMFTISSDQTIKVWQAKTGKLLGTLYLFNDGNDYVFVDPSGRFDGTEGGIKRMYYYRDRHKIPLDVVYERFYTPNMYQRLLAGEQFDPIDIVIKPSPLVKISYEEATRNLSVTDDVPTFQNKTGFANITVQATAEEDVVDEIRLFHNGKIVTLTTRNLFINDAATATDSKKYQVALLPGQNTLRAIALNTQRTESQPDDIVVNFSSPTNPTPSTPVPIANNTKRGPVATIEKTATLHLIVVGINAYKNPKLSLNYALADATAFKDQLEIDAKTVLSSVKTYFVTDGEADKNGISNAFAAVKQNSKPQDVFIFYYAGHGVIGDDKEFYLVPNDVADLKNMQDELVQKGIAAKALQQYAIDIQAQKQLFILDACQSAGAFEAMLSNDGNQQKSIAVVARSTGTHWMAASGSQQFANEFSQLGHGAFTYVLLQALQGAGAINKLVTVNGLKNFLQLNVPALMKKYHGIEQHPSSYGYGIDFPVGVVK